MPPRLRLPGRKTRSNDKTAVQTRQPSEIVEHDPELRMGFFQHLEELRRRMFFSLVALMVASAGGVFLAQPVLKILIEPYSSLYPDGQELIVLGPTGAVVAYFRVALLIGAVVAVPVITHQILLFILPGLTKRERRYVLLALPAIGGLFLTGVLFTWFVLMPPAINFLEGFQSEIFQAEWTADQYLGFVTALMFWMGVSFELPLVFFILSLLGMVRAGTLIKGWRVAIVGAAVAAAIITPTVDPVNMFLVMAPLLALYVISVGMVRLGTRIGGHDPRR